MTAALVEFLSQTANQIFENRMRRAAQRISDRQHLFAVSAI